MLSPLASGALAALALMVPCAPPQQPARTARTARAPLDGPLRVGHPFRAPPDPYAAGHRGADLIASPGAPVRAAASGVIGYAGWLAGRPVVSVIHGALRTTYEPVAPVVRPGTRVAAGTVLGHLMEGADHCPAPGATCLHWGLLRGETYLDPLRLLGGPVRLLPLPGAQAPDGSRGGDALPVDSAATGGPDVAAAAGEPAAAGKGRRGSTRPALVPAGAAAATTLALAAARRRRRAPPPRRTAAVI